jgi:hypothetical protein
MASYSRLCEKHFVYFCFLRYSLDRQLAPSTELQPAALKRSNPR